MTTRIIHHGDEAHVVYIARVSSNQENTDPGLLSWLIRQSHWSPFEMIGACIEVNTTRDIGRQLLRHRSFSFQEFSQRYAAVTEDVENREMRFKGGSNRQGSMAYRELGIESRMKEMAGRCRVLYAEALEEGIAPECARSILPEGFTPTKLYMNGTLRSWIHFCRERLAWNEKDDLPWAQRENYRIARSVYWQLSYVCPIIWQAIQDIDYIDYPREDV